MIANRPDPIDVGYCANVFPGETLAETRAALRDRMSRVRDSLGPGGAPDPFPVGLRVSGPASEELEAPDARAEFVDLLRELRFRPFTINGFPYGRFHGARVKENVYRPDWIDPERARYSVRLGRLLAELIQSGEGSVSSSPISFKAFAPDDAALDQAARHLAEVAWEYEALAERGVDLHLGLEPEPLCTLETPAETIEFFERRLDRAGAEHLVRTRGFSITQAREVIRRRVGVCYDTCHMAVEFESPEASLEALAKAGVRLSKIQISSALRLRPTPEGLRELERFADRVYLHQTIARYADGSLRRWTDIAPALADRAQLEQAEELRVHCHVPLFMTRGAEKDGPLETTSDFIAPVIEWLRGRNLVAHFELETYTWDVLPPELRGAGTDEEIHRHIAREIQWFNQILSSSTSSPTSPLAASGPGSSRT